MRYVTSTYGLNDGKSYSCGCFRDWHMNNRKANIDETEKEYLYPF